MLLLPDKISELSYRFSLRLAKLMEEYFNYSVEETFEKGKNIYSTRSNIVHSGEDSKINENMLIIHEYARKLILKYLEDNTMFNNKELDKLCLK